MRGLLPGGERRTTWTKPPSAPIPAVPRASRRAAFGFCPYGRPGSPPRRPAAPEHGQRTTGRSTTRGRDGPGGHPTSPRPGAAAASAGSPAHAKPARGGQGRGRKRARTSRCRSAPAARAAHQTGLTTTKTHRADRRGRTFPVSAYVLGVNNKGRSSSFRRLDGRQKRRQHCIEGRRRAGRAPRAGCEALNENALRASGRTLWPARARRRPEMRRPRRRQGPFSGPHAASEDGIAKSCRRCATLLMHIIALLLRKARPARAHVR